MVATSGTVEVSAQTLRNIQTYADAVGAGAVGLGGGIAVLSIGGGFSSGYSANGKQGDALATGSGSQPSVIGAVDGEISSVLSGALSGGSNSLPAIDPIKPMIIGTGNDPQVAAALDFLQKAVRRESGAQHG